jgi:hypothetical protein
MPVGGQGSGKDDLAAALQAAFLISFFAVNHQSYSLAF